MPSNTEDEPNVFKLLQSYYTPASSIRVVECRLLALIPAHETRLQREIESRLRTQVMEYSTLITDIAWVTLGTCVTVQTFQCAHYSSCGQIELCMFTVVVQLGIVINGGNSSLKRKVERVQS